ncbi:MAG: hypothetical protein H5T69_14340 [Chloroflexi bacterium]|nr:hypothetical protein [Chloroflexota bacterium]
MKWSAQTSSGTAWIVILKIALLLIGLAFVTGQSGFEGTFSPRAEVGAAFQGIAQRP